MRVEKYTLERREFGQAEGAHKLCASERRSQNPAARVRGPRKCLSFLGVFDRIDRIERVSVLGIRKPALTERIDKKQR